MAISNTLFYIALLATSVAAGGNNAINVNPNTQNGKHVDIAITTAGSDVYFAIMCAMGCVGLACIVCAAMKPRTDRIFFYITAAVNLTAMVAYFSMGSNLGWTPIDVEFVRTGNVGGVNREIFYVRYIDWFVTTPLLLMDILLTAGLPWPTIIWTIFIDEFMIITGLVGALVKSRYKWGYWTFGTVAMFYIFWQIGQEGRVHAKKLGSDVYKVYLSCGMLTLVIWLLYPLAWGLCEGANVITPDAEAVFYGVLDFIAKPCFSILFVIGHWNIQPGRMGLKIRDIDEDPMLYQEGKLGPGEKAAYTLRNGHGNGMGMRGVTTGAAVNGTNGTNGTSQV